MRLRRSSSWILASLAGGCVPAAPVVRPAPTVSRPLADTSDAGALELDAESAAPVANTGDASKETPRRVLFSQDSPYGRVLVLEEGDLRVLRFDNPESFDQSAISLSDPDSVQVEYVRFAMMALAYPSRVSRMVMIGLGGGTFSTRVHARMPATVIDAVEINPVVVEAARQFFGLVDDAKYRVHVADGEAFLRNATVRYDYALLDAYAADSMPEALTSEAFFTLVKQRLTREGVAVINIAVQGEAERRLVEHFVRVFPHTHCFEAPVDSNVILVGRAAPLPSDAELNTRGEALDRTMQLPFSLRTMLGTRGHGPAERCTSLMPAGGSVVPR